MANVEVVKSAKVGEEGLPTAEDCFVVGHASLDRKHVIDLDAMFFVHGFLNFQELRLVNHLYGELRLHIVRVVWITAVKPRLPVVDFLVSLRQKMVEAVTHLISTVAERLGYVVTMSVVAAFVGLALARSRDVNLGSSLLDGLLSKLSNFLLRRCQSGFSEIWCALRRGGVLGRLPKIREVQFIFHYNTTRNQSNKWVRRTTRPDRSENN